MAIIKRVLEVTIQNPLFFLLIHIFKVSPLLCNYPEQAKCLRHIDTVPLFDVRKLDG